MMSPSQGSWGRPHRGLCLLRAGHRPLHRRPQELLALQHLYDEFAPLLLHVVGVVALGQLDASKFNPYLGKTSTEWHFPPPP